MITERHLRVFYEVCKHMNMTKAAEAIHVSQPLLSQKISSLEYDTGIRLFTRSNRTLKITPAGQYLYEHWNNIIKSIEDTVEAAQMIQKQDEKGVNISFCFGISTQIEIQIMQRVRREFPDLQFSFQMSEIFKMRNELLEQKTDVAVAPNYDQGSLGGSIRHVTIAERNVRVVVASSHPLAKKDRLETVLWNLIQGISAGARLLESFMPSTSKKILEQLGDGHVTQKPEILFQRLDLEEVMKKVEELHPHKDDAAEDGNGDSADGAEKEGAVIDIEPKDEITFEQFGTMQFQVGEIIACEEVKKSKKLLCSQVKIGSQVKQIVSGIKAHYTPEEMVGKKVMVLVNLKPAKLAGVLSEGMLLCAEDADGNLSLMVPEKEMPAGAEIC